MKSYVITITEADDAELALAELEKQLSEITLLKNTVGIVSVSHEYINSDIYTAVVKSAPFPLMGMTTYTQNANGTIGAYLFSILVLSSDACEFAYGSSGLIPAKGDVTDVTQECYNQVRAKLNGEVKLALIYAPTADPNCSPHIYLNAISQIDERVPIYGSLCSADIPTSFALGTRALFGENIYSDRMVILLVSGELSPRFYVESVVGEAAVISEIGEITAAEDNRVFEINNDKINRVLENLGYSQGAQEDVGVLTTLFILSKRDSDGNLLPAAARALYKLTDGEGVFGGSMPIGSVLSIVVTTPEIIKSSARKLLRRIKEENNNKTVLMYSCLVRQVSLLDDFMREHEIVGEELAEGGFTYVTCTSGGEICPVEISETKAYNSEHNSSLTACVF